MSPVALAETLRGNAGRVKAVVPVHLYGHPADLPAIVNLARQHGIKVVEDCAQSHGAAVGARKAGTWGDAAAFSFYPTKNLGALGDGGAVLTSNETTAEKVRLLRQYGWRERYVSEMSGRNSRLDEVQAAILRVKLRHLDTENVVRARLAKRYLEQLGEAKVKLPSTAPNTTPVWHQFTVRTPQRDALREHLASNGIMCGVLYPTPIHRQPAYEDPALTLVHTERACAEVLCLPVHPAVQNEDVDHVCAEILRWSSS